LRIRADEGPELLVSNRVPGLADRIKTDATLQGLVLPYALRLVVRRLFEDDDEASWAIDWRALGDQVVGEPVEWTLNPQEDEEEVDRVVELIVRKFVSAQSYATRAADLTEKDNG
jgi:hypothetical protein